MYETIQSNWLMALAFSAGFPFLLGIIIKFVDKKKLLKITAPPAKLAGVIVSKFLITQIGKENAKKFENGLILTITYVIIKTVQEFELALLADNKRK